MLGGLGDLRVGVWSVDFFRLGMILDDVIIRMVIDGF